MTNTITLPAYAILVTAKVTHDGSDVRQYIIDHYDGVDYNSVDEFVSDLRSSSWQNGSFGLIYNHEIDLIMSNVDFRHDVYKYVNEYAECCDSPIEDLSDSTLLAIALDMAANDIASQIEHEGVEVVVEYEDNEDINPIRHYTREDRQSGCDLCDDIISKRISYIVSHSQYPISEDELISIEEQQSQLVYVL